LTPSRHLGQSTKSNEPLDAETAEVWSIREVSVGTGKPDGLRAGLTSRMEHVLLAGLFAASWSVFVGLFALGGAPVAHGSKTDRSGELVAGGLLIAAMMGWAAFLARPEFGWLLAVVLPLVMLSGGVITSGAGGSGALWPQR
jgi:hypothetical protein